MNPRVFRTAQTEIRTASEYYQGCEAGLGHRFLERLAVTFALIEENPDRFPVVTEVSTRRKFRSLSVDGLPCRVIYEIRPDEVLPVTVSHFRRRAGYWRRRKE